MTDYIERDDALKQLRPEKWGTPDETWWPENVLGTFLRTIPAADVRPVVRGRWLLEIEANGKLYCYHCSVCDGDFHYIGIKTKYDFCPNCGAEMR